MNNPQILFDHIRSFLGTTTNEKFTPQRILVVQAQLNSYINKCEDIGFETYYHFKISLSVDNENQNIRVGIIPLTLVGVEMLMSSGIPIDESLKKQIRKIQDEQLVHEILYHRRGEADQSERSLSDEAGTTQGQCELDEHDLEKEDSGGNVLPVADSGHDGSGGPEVQVEVKDTSGHSL